MSRSLKFTSAGILVVMENIWLSFFGHPVFLNVCVINTEGYRKIRQYRVVSVRQFEMVNGHSLLKTHVLLLLHMPSVFSFIIMCACILLVVFLYFSIYFVL